MSDRRVVLFQEAVIGSASRIASLPRTTDTTRPGGLSLIDGRIPEWSVIDPRRPCLVGEPHHLKKGLAMRTFFNMLVNLLPSLWAKFAHRVAGCQSHHLCTA